MRIYNANEEKELLKQIQASIKQVGQQIPIVIDSKGNVLDGNIRMKACKALRIHPKIVRVDQLDQQIWKALNVDRRHLSINQRALIAVELANTAKGSNQHTAGAVSQNNAAEKCGVSPDTIQRVKKALSLGQAMGCLGEVKERLARDESPAQIVRTLDMRMIGEENRKIAKKNGNAMRDLKTMVASKIKASVIYADPPWDYGGANNTSDAAPERHYPLMPLGKIEKLGRHVQQIAGKDSILWLWVPSSLLEDGLAVLHSWGFEFVTTIVWCKPNSRPSPGAILPQHEIVLVGKRGLGLKTDETFKSVVKTKGRTAHSAKPEIFARTIERLYPHAPKLEMFARKKRDGWITWGNQAK